MPHTPQNADNACENARRRFIAAGFTSLQRDRLGPPLHDLAFLEAPETRRDPSDLRSSDCTDGPAGHDEHDHRCHEGERHTSDRWNEENEHVAPPERVPTT